MQMSKQVESSICFLGDPSNNILKDHVTFQTTIKYEPQAFPSQKTHPLKIFGSANNVAIIDSANSLWVLESCLGGKLCLSDILKYKFTNLFMGESQLIAETKKKELVMISWGAKNDFSADKVKKVHITHPIWGQIIDSCTILNSKNSVITTSYVYNLAKKNENNTKIFEIKHEVGTIICYPSEKRLDFNEEIVGLSVGKHHCLSWMKSGALFAWGAKSLGLGFQEYHQIYYEQPQPVPFISKPIVKACAVSHYSLALTCEGDLLQWGQKETSKGVQYICKPTPIQFTENQCTKFVDIKVKDQYFAALSSSNQLYFWGMNVPVFSVENRDSFTDFPKKVKQQKDVKIIDFELFQNLVAIVVSKSSGILIKEEERYFNQLNYDVSRKYLPNKKMQVKHVRTATMDVRNFERNYKTSSSMRPKAKNVPTIRKGEDYIDRIVGVSNSKEDYFQNLMQSEQKIFDHVKKRQPYIHYNTTQVSSRNSVKPEREDQDPLSSNSISQFASREDLNPPIDLPAELKNTKDFIKKKEQKENLKLKKFLKNIYRVNSLKNSQVSFMKTNNFPKHMAQIRKRTNVLQKKQLLERSRTQKYLKNFQQKEKSFVQRKKANLHQKSEAQILKKTIVSILKRDFLIRLLTAPLGLGRELKIKHFMTNLSLNRINYKMKNMVMRNRIKKWMATLAIKHPQQLLVLTTALKSYIKKWKARKHKKCKRRIIFQMIKKNLQNSLLQKMPIFNYSIRKIQVLCKWQKIVTKERQNYYKLLWKKNLLQNIHRSKESRITQSNIVKYEEELNHKLQGPKIISFSTFARKSAIFNLQIKGSPDLLRLLYLNKVGKRSKTAKFELKKKRTQNLISFSVFNESSFDFQKTLPLYSDILVYSQHYDLFSRPRNYDLNLTQQMKASPEWVKEEEKILNHQIKNIVKKDSDSFLAQVKTYERALAVHICDNYLKIGEERWVYIIEYNSLNKKQQQKQKDYKLEKLKRILRIINAQSLLDNDILPEKHRIIDIALTLTGCPEQPKRDNIKFKNKQFKEYFKLFFEEVHSRAKYYRHILR